MVRLRGWISSDRREKEESIRYLFLIAIKRLRSQLTPRVSRSGTSASPRKGLSPVNIVSLMKWRRGMIMLSLSSEMDQRAKT